MNGGPWGVRNRGGGSYNQDVQDHVDRMNEETEKLVARRKADEEFLKVLNKTETPVMLYVYGAVVLLLVVWAIYTEC